jgi:hypothetical protein
MPTVGQVAGFLILMYFKDHGDPHFHILGKGTFAKMTLMDQQLVDVKGELKPAELRAIRTWARRHLPELYAAWQTAQTGGTPEQIKD